MLNSCQIIIVLDNFFTERSNMWVTKEISQILKEPCQYIFFKQDIFRKCLWDVDCLWHSMQNDWSTLSALYSMHISYPNTCFFLSLTNHYESTLSRLLCPITLTSVFAKMHPIVPSWLESQVSNDWRLSSWYRTMGLKPF